MPAAGLLAVVLTGCGPVYPQYALNSDQYFADRGACIQEAYRGQDAFGKCGWSRERFSGCMLARGWRNP
jgi:hypothetical protein